MRNYTHKLHETIWYKTKYSYKNVIENRDVVIHIFDEENRLFYDLERIWGDGSLINREDLN